jgi:hypothetical protein
MPGNEPLPLLNVFEIADDQGGTRHLLAFIEPALASSAGIDPSAIVGEITPTEGGGYDPMSLKLNSEFIEAITDYMNDVQAVEPVIIEQARIQPSAWVYVIDPRNAEPPGVEPHAGDVVGAFAVDDSGQVVPRSFQYNVDHALIDQERGMTGLFHDRRFYDWLHPST